MNRNEIMLIIKARRPVKGFIHITKMINDRIVKIKNENTNIRSLVVI